jgi:hypothetical protein
MPFLRLGLLGLALALLVGCTGGGGASLDGTVTLDDTPVDGGLITLVPEGGGKSGQSDIKAGKYSISDLEPRKYKVQVSWRKKTGQEPYPGEPGKMQDVFTEQIPSSWKETVDIQPGSNSKNFTIKK